MSQPKTRWLFAWIGLLAPVVANACPFCNAVSQTLRQEMEVMDAVVIATALQNDVERNKEAGEVLMSIQHVLKGSELASKGQEVTAGYYGEVVKGRTFMLSGVDPPDLQWSCLPLSERSRDYVLNIAKLDDDPVARLRFFHKFLEDEETILARDAYDEFAIAPYAAIKSLAPEMNHQQLVDWITDPEMTTDRKRLYLTMLGVSGSKDDLQMLEKIMRSTKKSSRGGLDALIACYLTLAGEDGLPIVAELFLNNKKSPYADTYAAIMAIRFHGTEGDVIPRSALTESLRHVLERKDLADLVIPDLARWSDWSQIDRMVSLFTEADVDNNWVRVPVVNYLRACPLPEAEEALKKLEEIDPEAVRRAKTFFSIPIPSKEPKDAEEASNKRSDENRFVALPVVSTSADGGELVAGELAAADSFVIPLAVSPITANSLRFFGVVLMALSTVVIAVFLLLTGGALPDFDQA